MAAKTCPNDDFIDLFREYGAAKTSRILGVTERAVYRRRETVERQLGRSIAAPERSNRVEVEHPARITAQLENGTIIVGSDAHYWPRRISTAHKAFVHFIQKLQPDFVIANGDFFDGARISRFSPIGWEDTPTVEEELGAVQNRMAEIEAVCPNARKVWTLGNHDGRFETKLCAQAPEYAGVHGFSLKDHFPYWEPCWSIWINDEVVIKHRFRGGIHGAYNSTLHSGKTTVTGHTHKLGARPLTDYNGSRWGVETGTLADPWGPQFENYLEDNPRDWRSGFVVLTFVNGRLMWPEVVHVIEEGKVEFRGEVVEV